MKRPRAYDVWHCTDIRCVFEVRICQPLYSKGARTPKARKKARRAYDQLVHHEYRVHPDGTPDDFVRGG